MQVKTASQRSQSAEEAALRLDERVQSMIPAQQARSTTIASDARGWKASGRADEPIPAQSLNQLIRAIAQWENEGGATSSSPDEENDGLVVLSLAEQHILQCLGAAVIAQWNELPTDVQKALFEHAVSSGDPRHSIHLREQIARFLHNHKDDALGRVQNL
jgi:hypothetical protein